MLETLKSSRDDFNVLENFNVSSIKTAINSLVKLGKNVHRETKIIFGIATFPKKNKAKQQQRKQNI